MSGGDFDLQAQAHARTIDQGDASDARHDDAPATSAGPGLSYAGPFPPVSGEHLHRADPASASDRAHGAHGAHGAHAAKPLHLGDVGDISVKFAAVDLKTGEPRTAILEAVTQVAGSWNLMISNMSSAVEQLVQTIGHAEFKKADAGLLEKLWSRAEGLLVKAAECVSGTALAEELGVTAIKKVLAKGETLEQKRIQADEDAFLRDLRESAKSAQLEGVRDGGNMRVHKIVDKLDGEFLAVGARGEKGDAWKRGDRNVVGAQASFLQDLQQRADAYTSSVPTTSDFVGDFLVDFVQANHKRRKRSAWRTPFVDAEYQDGYVGLDLELKYDEAYLGWFVAGAEGATGDLHCPKAGEVAEAITETHPDLNLWDLNLPVRINLKIDEKARDHLPEYLRGDSTRQVEIDSGVADARSKPIWEYATREAKTSTEEILHRVRKLRG